MSKLSTRSKLPVVTSSATSQTSRGRRTARPSGDGSKLTFFDKMASTAYRMFGTQGKKIAASSPQMRDEILKSNLRITPEALVSLALFTTVISIVPVAICVVLGLVLHILFLFMLVVVPPIVFVIVWNSAKISQGSRSEALENELPMLIGFLGVLSGARESVSDALLVTGPSF